MYLSFEHLKISTMNADKCKANASDITGWKIRKFFLSKNITCTSYKHTSNNNNVGHYGGKWHNL